MGIGCEPEQLPNIILDKERRLRLRLLPSLKLRQARRLRECGVQGVGVKGYSVSMVAGMCWVMSSGFGFKHQVTGIIRLVQSLGSVVS